MNKEKLTADFVQHFILKEKRERCLFELTHPQKRGKFINKLNHACATIFDMRRLTLIPKNKDDYALIKAQLKVKDKDLCYIISNYADIDDMEMPFDQAFNKSYGRGFATLIIVSAGKIYLETEQVQGAPNRYISNI